MADICVDVVNNSGQTVGLRVEENGETHEYLKKCVRREDLVSVTKVSPTKSAPSKPTPKPPAKKTAAPAPAKPAAPQGDAAPKE